MQSKEKIPELFGSNVFNDAVMQQHIAKCGMLAHPGMPLPRAARQQVIRAERTGQVLRLQIRITLDAAFQRTEQLLSVSVYINYLVGLQIADINDLVDLVQDPQYIHIRISRLPLLRTLQWQLLQMMGDFFLPGANGAAAAQHSPHQNLGAPDMSKRTAPPRLIVAA